MRSSPSASFVISWRETTPPVGLAGELMMMRRVCWRDEGEHLLGIEAEVLFLADRVGYRFGAAGASRIAIGWKSRIGIEDFRSRPAEKVACEIECHLAAGNDHDLVAGDRDIEASADILGHGVAQDGQTLRRSVAMRARPAPPFRRLREYVWAARNPAGRCRD